jgi:hypothetical protein
MRARPDKRKQHPKVVTYFRPIGSDGWRVEMNQGARIVRRLAVDTKEEAITATKAMLAEYPEAEIQLPDLGEVHAWAVDGEWVYSTVCREGSIAARLIDELGELVLMIRDGDGTRFIRGARQNEPWDS